MAVTAVTSDRAGAAALILCLQVCIAPPQPAACTLCPNIMADAAGSPHCDRSKYCLRRDLSTPTFGGSGSNAAAAQLETEADANLQSHFDSIQIISERTTLPQMLAELGKGLNRHADVATLVLQLK